MKTLETIRIEEALLKQFTDQGQTSVAEVTIGYYGRESCDVMRYETNGEFTCFEIKVTVPDFHSKNKLSFHGHKNYFVLTPEVYEKVKDEIPEGIGVYLAREIYASKYDFEQNKEVEIKPRRFIRIDLECIKRCRKRDLVEYKPDQLLAYMLRSSLNKTNFQRRGLVSKRNLFMDLKAVLKEHRIDDKDIERIKVLIVKEPS